jgi:hypothetical protein
MLPLLNSILEAHGGLDRWARFSKVEVDVVTGWGLFPLKGLQPDLSKRRMAVWLKEERADYLLRRHDYHVDIAGSFAAAQLTTDYIESDGIKLPTRRRAYAMGADRRPIPELLMVAIDLSNPSYT